MVASKKARHDSSGSRATPVWQRLFTALPKLLLAISFVLACWEPQSHFAAHAADSRWMMLLEGAQIFASVLVGGFIQVAEVFFPLIMLGVLGWLVSSGRAGLSWTLACFVWAVIAAFREGLRAHRGEFGFARENPDHPHRRYDRMVFAYLGTLPIAPLAWLYGGTSPWLVWGAIYFALSAAIETLLRDAFDRIPRAMLRRMQAGNDPQLAAKMGICRRCQYVQPAIPASEGRYVRCLLSTRDNRFLEYPRTPLSACDGFRQRDS